MRAPHPAGLSRASITREGPSVVCPVCGTATPLATLRGQADASVLQCRGCGEVVVRRQP